MDVSEAKRLKALEEENAKLKKVLAEQMLDAAAFRELLSKNVRARRQARCGRASAGRHESVGTADLLDRGRGSEVDPLSLQPPCGRGSARLVARSGGGSATAGYSSCCDGRESPRGSIGSTGLSRGRAHRPQAAGSPQSCGDPCSDPDRCEAQRALVAGLRPRPVRQRPALPHSQHRRRRH